MKKILAYSLISILSLSLISCGGEKHRLTSNCEKLDPIDGATDIKVGMVTDSGSIDDKSFNEGTWAGIKCYESKNKATIKYQKPTGEAQTDYMASIKNLVDTGHQVVITPGYKFETSVYEAQSKYPDTTFILLDGVPHNGDFNAQISKNTLSIFFAEEQAGFLVGVTAALNTKTNKLGFIGGMEIPPVQRFGWGYIAGVAYANKTYGTEAKITNFVYQGTFIDAEAGKSLAAGMYDNGIDIIFHAAAAVGNGIFSEAKSRAENGENVYVIGVDIDQYDQGKYGDGSKSVTLTSAVKKIDVAAYKYIGEIANGTFVGGKSIVLDVKEDGVGLPLENPNMNSDSKEKVSELLKQLKENKINIPKSKDELLSFVKEQGYTDTTIIK